jgi:hypothetical protein
MPRFARPLVALLCLIAATSVLAQTQVSLPTFGAPGTPENRSNLDVASSGSGYLAVWEERPTSGPQSSSTVVLRPLAADGAPRTSAATTIANGSSPAVTWDGTAYLVVWGVTPLTTSGIVRPQTMLCARFDENGAEIAGSRTDLSPIDEEPAGIDVAWNGTSYLITWAGSRYTSGLLLSGDFHSRQSVPVAAAVSRRVVASSGGRFAVVALTDEGLVIFALFNVGEPGIQKAINSGVQTIDVASRGSDTAVVMTSPNGVTALTIDNNGGVYPTISLDAAASQTPPAVTVAGSSYLAAWMTPRTSGGQQLCTARFSDARETPICNAVTARLQRPAVSSSDTTSLLAWSDSVGNVDRIKADVVPLPATPSARAEAPILSVVAQAQGAATIGLHGRGMLLAWSEYNSTLRRAQIMLEGIAPNGRQLPPRILWQGDGVQVEPRIALGNQQALVVWTEITETAFQVRGVTLDADGRLDNPVALEIGNGVAPSVAFNGQSWIVIWQSQRFGDPQPPQLLTTAISSTGLVVTRGGNRILPTTTAQLAPEVVWTGNAYVVAWDEVIGFGANEVRDVVASSLDSSGNLASGRNVLAHIDGAQVLGPWVATAEGRTGVSWFTFQEGANPIDFALVDDQGTRLEQVRRLATLPFPILDGRLLSSYAGSFAFGYLYDFNASPAPPRTLTVFRFAPETGAILTEAGINAEVTDFDFVYADEQVIFSYARQMAPLERYGNTTRAFIRAADPVGRRRIGGH